MQQILDEINHACQDLNTWVENQAAELLKKNKKVGLIGGEHSCPLGFLRALGKKYDQFGILQIDAHLDLRKAYEGFSFSHASIFYNALKIPSISNLVQVGIRDYCAEEVTLAEQDPRITVHFDHDMKRKAFKGMSWHEQCLAIIDQLPEAVYISFDIDGLNPALCPNTGTPVPGGLSYPEARYLISLLLETGRQIIGFDLCEVGGKGNEWDGNVGARVAYDLAVATLLS